jgi:mannose/cellobiose epimerase-like protein (N-acyl-D-glucosamine 2-epimerase family)
MRTKQWIASVCREWANNLPECRGGFAESVLPLWQEGPERSYTMLTQARLAFTFLHSCPEHPAAERAVSRVMDLFWNPQELGWIRSCSAEGEPIDKTIDTYDQGFGLLSLAWNYRRKRDETAKERAYEALEGLNRFTRDENYGGYWERRNGSAPSLLVRYPDHRRQNPHMHLLEAFLAWNEADPTGPWLLQARSIVELFRTRFRVAEKGHLAEYFEKDWTLAQGEPGNIREPGHQFEWVWLLYQYEQATGDRSVREDAEKLYSFARDKGTDTDGLAFASITDDGRVMDDHKLLWPQTEMLKAHLAMYHWTQDRDCRKAAEATYSALRTRYMLPDGALFYNQLDREGRPIAAPSLSRLLYHLYLGAYEAEHSV